MHDNDKRWDTDEIGHGVGSGEWIAPSVQTLADVLRTPDWIAEDPDVHLLPHLQRAVDVPGSPWSLRSSSVKDGVYIVNLTWLRPQGRLRELRADVFTLLGSIVEGATYVHGYVEEDTVIYDVATGMLTGDGPLRGHGHILQLHVERDSSLSQ